MTAQEGPIDDTQETLGSFLRKARIRQGLELATIAEETRVTAKNLIAIEEDNRPALPADVLSRGFVKIYAAYLKLDPLEAIGLFDRQWVAEPPSFSKASHPGRTLPSSPPALTWSGLIIILILFALVIGDRFFSQPPPGGSGTPAYAASGDPVVTALRLTANDVTQPSADAAGEGEDHISNCP